MATLGSPGVQVTVIDESFYTPAPPGTVPLIFVATAQDKSNASKTGTAQGTTAANNDKVWVITSQRDLTDTFGTPLFPTDSNGNSIHGGELNEYGLQAAYSLLGVSSRAYIARADVDLGQLTPNTSVPVGDPHSGTYWIDSDSSLYGINEWDDTTGKFTVKTPLIVDDDNVDTVADGNLKPKEGYLDEVAGDYAMVVTSDNEMALWYRTSSAWVLVTSGFDGGKDVQISPHTDYPSFTGSPTGSVWVKTTSPGQGASWLVKYYSGSTQTWGTVSAPIYASTQEAIQKLDYAGGGAKIASGALFIESDWDRSDSAIFRVWRRASTGKTQTVTPASATTSSAATQNFVMRETLASSTSWGSNQTITVAAWSGGSPKSVAENMAAAINGAMTNVVATYDPATTKVTLSHKLGGDIALTDGTDTPLAKVGFSTSMVNVYNDYDGYDFLVSNWKPLTGHECKASEPTTLPSDGQLWYDANLTDVDIMVHDGTTWVGYLNEFPSTDPLGPTVSATEPTTQQDGISSLVDGDIWVSTADTDMYGKNVYVYSTSDGWVLQDTTDQTSPDGWVFADARWGTAGSDTSADRASIADLLSSDYLDPDAPDPALYPRGIRLWNTRRSGYNVKKFVSGHLDLTANSGVNPRYTESMSGYTADRWTTVSPNNEDGSGTFGRLAQRSYVVAQLKSFVDTNAAIRDTDTLNFNLIACPGYPEVIANMVGLNTERGQTAFVVGDSPFRLEPTGTAISNWAGNNAGAYDNGESGLVTHDQYLAVFYPSGYTTDNSGKQIVVPPSHMMLRTIVNSDAKSYQWFAPAGTRRGGVDNATSVGYITGEGEFKTVALHEGLRDVMQDPVTKLAINPIATLPGIGLVNFGQQTRASESSALDRINVVRLVAYLRRQLAILAKPFLFEPNDAQTRREIKQAAESLLLELVGQRALYDFIVVCDTTNNTPARIDRSELYMDIAIEPVKAVEFIYIPLRIKNTGEIRAGR